MWKRLNFRKLLRLVSRSLLQHRRFSELHRSLSRKGARSPADFPRVVNRFDMRVANREREKVPPPQHYGLYEDEQSPACETMSFSDATLLGAKEKVSELFANWFGGTTFPSTFHFDSLSFTACLMRLNPFFSAVFCAHVLLSLIV